MPTIRAKKSLGQHFLHDPRTIRRIVELSAVSPSDTVVEIGPGTGALTKQLLITGAHVIAIEFDRDMVALLRSKWPPDQPEHPLEIIQCDILDVRWEDILPPHPVKFVGNLPYNIATRIVKQMIELKDRFQSFTFMVQKEVATRLLARPGGKDYGYLTLLTEYHFRRAAGFDVPPGAFSPPPKVMSHVMQLLPLHREHPPELVDRFEAVISRAFQERRKTLRNNLVQSFSTGAVDQAFAECDVSPRARGEELDLEGFMCLARLL